MSNMLSHKNNQSDEQLNEKSLKKVLHDTIETIDDNKSRLFEIYEASRNEMEEARAQLKEVRERAANAIDKVDNLERRLQQQRQRYVMVSQSFNKYSEEEFMKCNEEIMNLQTQLEVARDEEKHLIEGRNCLERRVHSLDGLVKKAEHMAMAIGSVMSYLNQTINEAADRVEEAEKNKGLGARIIEAQEHERFRLAREIHDGPAQDMANLIFMTSVAEKLADKDPEECKKTIKDFREQVRSSLSDIRQVIFDMRPMSLDDLGLAPAVRQLSQKLVERETLRTVDFEVQGEEYPVAKHIETAVFRIVQEALNNVAHHSGTDSAKVRIVYASNAVSIVIEDKGNGFDMSSAYSMTHENDKENHYGLLSMKERASIVGAEFHISSAVDKGTKVQIRVTRQGNNINGRKVA